MRFRCACPKYAYLWLCKIILIRYIINMVCQLMERGVSIDNKGCQSMEQGVSIDGTGVSFDELKVSIDEATGC